MSTIEVRVADPAEYPVVGELVVEAYRTVGHEQDAGYEAYMRDVAARAGRSSVLVGLLEGSIVGTVTYVHPGSPMAEVDDPDGANVRMLGVAAAMRGRGVGEALVRGCIERARADGALRVRLHTEPFMAAAQRLYVRLGFVRDPAHDWTPVPDVDLLAYVLDLVPA